MYIYIYIYNVYIYIHIYIRIDIQKHRCFDNSHFSTVLNGPNPGSFGMVNILYTIDGVSTVFTGTTATGFLSIHDIIIH